MITGVQKAKGWRRVARDPSPMLRDVSLRMGEMVVISYLLLAVVVASVGYIISEVRKELGDAVSVELGGCADERDAGVSAGVGGSAEVREPAGGAGGAAERADPRSGMGGAFRGQAAGAGERDRRPAGSGGGPGADRERGAAGQPGSAGRGCGGVARGVGGGARGGRRCASAQRSRSTATEVGH